MSAPRKNNKLTLAQYVQVQHELQESLVCVDAHSAPRLYEYRDSLTDEVLAAAVATRLGFHCTGANVAFVRRELFGELRRQGGNQYTQDTERRMRSLEADHLALSGLVRQLCVAVGEDYDVLLRQSLGI